ncbi:MAG: PepSY-associated TM helix domain-containing protein [Ignavibacteriae bacterium]|nr:PepSY-associated TM helix domain-containing protein [Ignavibacteriota bacterium]
MIKWRKWNNILHRDIGYLVVGLTLIYGVSGIAVNHTADWNPSYRQEKQVREIAPIAATEREAMFAEALQKLEITETPRNVFRPDPETLQMFFERRTYTVDVPTGKVLIERVHHRPVLYEMNQLHLNTPKGAWTYIADLYAGSLIIIAITGLFVLKGRNGISGRGWWLTLIGIVIPVGYWIWYQYLS